MIQEDKFTEYIKDHMKLILKVASIYCRDTEERKDLIQDIILQLWKSFPRYNSEYAFSTWTYRIALNVSISHVRKSTFRQSTFQNFKEHITIEQRGDDQNQSNLNRLYDALKILKPLDKAIISLNLDGCSNKEICEITGVTATNVSTRLNRIRTKLKKHLNHK